VIQGLRDQTETYLDGIMTWGIGRDGEGTSSAQGQIWGMGQEHGSMG
jgi:hypothetical protein